MSSKNKYPTRKITVAITSVLIGITAVSLGTAYAQEDNNSIPTVKMKHDENKENEKKIFIEGKVLKGNNESSNLKEVSPTSIEKSESLNPLEDKVLGRIIKEKIDWNSIDEKEFVNFLFSDIKVDKNKEREIKEVWLIKVNELLVVNPNNINLQKVKSILENSLKDESSAEVEKPKEEKVTEDKKENK